MQDTVVKNPTWWRRRTAMERGMTLLSAIAFTIAIAVSVAFAVVVLRDKQADTLPSLPAALQGGSNFTGRTFGQHDVCLTPGCVHAASNVLKSMDMSIEPCDDFYQFACGNYIQTHNIPDDKSTVNTFTHITDQLMEKLRTMVEEPMSPNEGKPFKLVKRLYRACMNKTLIESRGLEPIRKVLAELGGWPVVDGPQWDENEFDWRQSVYRFRKNGYSVDYFMDFSVATDAKNSSYRSINLDQAALGVSREYLVKGLEDKIVNAYYQYMVDVAVLLGAERSDAEKELKDSLNFEIALANISLPSEERRNVSKLYNLMTISEMEEKFKSVPWLEYFRNILPSNIEITPNEPVVVAVPNYITQLEELLAETPKRVLGNYVMWRATGASISYLNEELRARQLKFYTVLSGKTEREPRWKECIDIVAGGVSLSVGALYVRKYFKEDAKKNAMEMVENIRAEFIEILQNVDWMDDATKDRAIDKAKAMAVHIAYPDELLDNSKLEDFYMNLEVSQDDYMGSVLNLTKFGTNYSFGRLRNKVNKTEWITHGRPAIVNAFYSSIENSIQFPAGILQGTFFQNDRPRYMNYGAIGFVIGHEITHGFDDQGRQFDKDGNLVDWWAPDTKTKYLKKASCIIHQYGNYTEEETGLKLNGINTQGENIADNGGIKEAYGAYMAWSERNGPEPSLPGLPYSPRQLFWISAAQTWCNKYRPEAMRQRITTGVHSPGRFRVLGPFSNRPEFSKDFGCPIGSKMNPEHKCQVW
ncbi:neprilysin-2 isoform X2 [Anabrus simplex]|uniref:neprilysin-2 isoform X2 n=1 Tax=Anabrus simplex TaxID=316456 RepID=UPI0035A32457